MVDVIDRRVSQAENSKTQISDLGFATDVPIRSEDSGFVVSNLTPFHWYLLSRVDGKTTLNELIGLSGQPREETITLIRNLIQLGCISLPNAKFRGSDVSEDAENLLSDLNWSKPSWNFSFDNDLLSANSALPLSLRKLILYYYEHLRTVSYYDILGVDPAASIDDIKGAYYRLTKLVHPDRWFRQNLGPFVDPLGAVFNWTNKAFQTVSNPRRRKRYDRLLERGLVGPWQEDPGVSSSEKEEPEQKDSSNRMRRHAFFARGRKSLFRGELDEAIDNFRKAYQLDEDCEAGIALAAAMLQKKGKWLHDARTLITKLRARYVDNHEVMMVEAKLFSVTGDRPRARCILETILAEEPEFPGALDALRSL